MITLKNILQLAVLMILLAACSGHEAKKDTTKPDATEVKSDTLPAVKQDIDSIPPVDFIFPLEVCEGEKMAFVSLSEIDPLSTHLDSLAIPNLSKKNEENAAQFEHLNLGPKYRKRFLYRTGISETDQLFIYSYEKNKLLALPISSLKLVAYLTPYDPRQWPYTQQDYYIGFEIDMKLLKDFAGEYCTHTLAYVGEKNPFVSGELKKIAWRKISRKEFPSKKAIIYDTTYIGECVPKNTYKYETDSLQYYLQDYASLIYEQIFVKHLLVRKRKTKELVCEKIYLADGDGTSFAPMDEQWTGKLFKNDPQVIFGFQYHSFGCSSITVLDSKKREIYINCDNRH